MTGDAWEGMGMFLMFFTDPCILLPQLQEWDEPQCLAERLTYKLVTGLFAVRGSWDTWLIHRGIKLPGGEFTPLALGICTIITDHWY